jgi:hypothetical protein
MSERDASEQYSYVVHNFTIRGRAFKVAAD